jgi:hypothetical protein
MSAQSRRRTLRAVAPVAGLLAAGLLVWQGSYAAFSATTDNTGNAWATGSLNLTNNGGGATYGGSTTALFNEANLRPGSTGVKCITVQSDAGLGGDMRLWATPSGNAALQAALQVKIDSQTLASASTNVAANCTGFTGTTAGARFNGVLSGMPASWGTAGGTSVTVPTATTRVAYRIEWTLPSSVTDNGLLGKSASAGLTWELQTS